MGFASFVALTNNKEDISSFVLVEFKKPKRDDYTSSDNPIEQILDYVDIIRSGKCNIKKYKHGNYYNDPITLDSNIPIYAYIIADITVLPSLLIRSGMLDALSGLLSFD